MKDDRIRLQHILDALERIDRHCENSQRDEKTASAVLYELTIIGEASRVLTESTKQELNSIPWIDIVGMRNRIVHEYFNIDYPVLWATIDRDLPELKKVISGYLKLNK